MDSFYYIHGPWGDETIFAVLHLSFNSDRYTVSKKRQFLYISICSFLSTIFIYILTLVHDNVRTKC